MLLGHVQVLQAKTKVANGRVFDLAIKMSQGNLPDQIYKVSLAVHNVIHICELQRSGTVRHKFCCDDEARTFHYTTLDSALPMN